MLEFILDLNELTISLYTLMLLALLTAIYRVNIRLSLYATDNGAWRVTEKLNNHPLEAGGLERLATESRDTGQIALLFPLTILRFEIIIRTRFKMMLKIILYHFFGHLPYCDTKITSCPKMLAPISLF